MNKKIILLLVSSCFLFGLLSGCQEQEIQSVVNSNVVLESDVVELVNGSIEFLKDDNKETKLVNVYYMLHNIAKRKLEHIQIRAEFYNEDNELLGISEPKNLYSIPKDYTEQFDPNFNKIVYDSANANQVDNVILKVVEVKL